jgi:hypothetical protein
LFGKNGSTKITFMPGMVDRKAPPSATARGRAW